MVLLAWPSSWLFLAELEATCHSKFHSCFRSWLVSNRRWARRTSPSSVLGDESGKVPVGPVARHWRKFSNTTMQLKRFDFIVVAPVRWFLFEVLWDDLSRILDCRLLMTVCIASEFSVSRTSEISFLLPRHCNLQVYLVADDWLPWQEAARAGSCRTVTQENSMVGHFHYYCPSKTHMESFLSPNGQQRRPGRSKKLLKGGMCMF